MSASVHMCFTIIYFERSKVAYFSSESVRRDLKVFWSPKNTSRNKLASHLTVFVSSVIFIVYIFLLILIKW
jgi:uncharacterized membrane protein